MNNLGFAQILKIVTIIYALSKEIAEAKEDGSITTTEAIQILIVGIQPIMKMFDVDLTDELEALKVALNVTLDDTEIQQNIAAKESKLLAE